MAVYSHWLNKVIYLGHTKFLPMDHEMRFDPLLYSSFDMPYGDLRECPEPIPFAYWKSIAERAMDPNDEMSFQRSGLTRWSILATLPYWGDLLIRHLLDPMHIEGNVGKSLIRSLYGERDPNFREACEEHERHPDVWISIDDITHVEHHPSAPWVLSTRQKKEFRSRIGAMQFPTGYGANLQKAFGGEDSHKWPAYLKTHDYHRLLQHVIPVAIMGLGNDDLEDAIWSLGKLLRWICSKEILVEEIPSMEILGAEVVCKLERALPPIFFDSQVRYFQIFVFSYFQLCNISF